MFRLIPQCARAASQMAVVASQMMYSKKASAKKTACSCSCQGESAPETCGDGVGMTFTDNVTGPSAPVNCKPPDVCAPPPQAEEPTPSDVSTAAAGGGSTTPVFKPFPMIEGLLERKPLAIARAITLVESVNPSHAAVISALLRELKARNAARDALRRAKNKAGGITTHPLPPPSRFDDPDNPPVPTESLFAANLEANRAHNVGCMRIAISGSPGAGKSCFIEALGMLLAETYGLRVGVIAVDPSSVVSGGSLLGDKTRMEKLSTCKNAFVRPSPSRGHLGGVTARCWESMEIFEAADFDVILVETVGVGQSEVAARSMTDLFLLLVPPASGDELQGIKKGIVEVADLIAVTKDDGERKALVDRTKAAYTKAVMFHRNSHNVGGSDDTSFRATGVYDPEAMSDTLKPVLAISSETNPGSIAILWNRVERMWLHRRDTGRLSALRKRQCMENFNEYFRQELIERARKTLGDAYLTRLEDEVVGRGLSPRQAGEIALKEVLKPKCDNVFPVIPY